jgi:hypothetical protein
MATEAMVTVGPDGRISGATASDAETLADLAGGTYRCVLTTPRGRSLGQLGLWWAMCGLIADNHPADLTKENVSDTLKIECGHARVWQDSTGLYRRSPKSIAFNAMPPDAFSALLDRALAKSDDLFGEGLTDAVRGELASMGATTANDDRAEAA